MLQQETSLSLTPQDRGFHQRMWTNYTHVNKSSSALTSQQEQEQAHLCERKSLRSSLRFIVEAIFEGERLNQCSTEISENLLK